MAMISAGRSRTARREKKIRKLIPPVRCCSEASMAVIRKPLNTKNTPSPTYAPGSVLKLEWKIKMATINGARIPVSDGRFPSVNSTGDRADVDP